ncbi:MAG TPA: hypothetical protein VGM11_15550 [Acidobacteriaceae bacterium]
MTLHPGDIVSTGTPPGIGLRQKPARYFAAATSCRSASNVWANSSKPLSLRATESDAAGSRELRTVVTLRFVRNAALQ